MRIFGLDIQRCSKTDIEQLGVYKLVVNELFDRLVTYLDLMSAMINDKTEIEEDAAIQLMFQHVETITKLVMLYQDNKFSTPLTNVSICKKMEALRQQSGALQELMLYHMNTQSRINRYEQEHDEEEEDEEYSTIKDEYDDVNSRYYQQRSHQCKMIFADINRMISIIQYDVFKLIFGVDIIRDFYNNKRRKGKPAFMVKIYNNYRSMNKEDIL